MKQKQVIDAEIKTLNEQVVKKVSRLCWVASQGLVERLRGVADQGGREAV